MCSFNCSAIHVHWFSAIRPVIFRFLIPQTPWPFTIVEEPISCSIKRRCHWEKRWDSWAGYHKQEANSLLALSHGGFVEKQKDALVVSTSKFLKFFSQNYCCLKTKFPEISDVSDKIKSNNFLFVVWKDELVTIAEIDCFRFFSTKQIHLRRSAPCRSSVRKILVTSFLKSHTVFISTFSQQIHHK